MNLDGARNAKAEIFTRVLGFTEQQDRGPGELPTFSAAPADVFGDAIDPQWSGSVTDDTPAGRRARPARPALAIGIRPARGGRSARLALIGESRSQRSHPAVAQALQLARGEADFVAVGTPRALSFWQPPRRRPLAIGLSVGHFKTTAGTLGGFVVMRDGSICMLSNNHVLANVNRGLPGDAILQPAPGDGGHGDVDVIGSLRHFVPIDTTPGAVNIVDCAVADLAPGIDPSALRADPAAVAIRGAAGTLLFADDPVLKVGRTTGLTSGRVFAVEVDNYMVNMGTSTKPLRCRFDDQIQVESADVRFAANGDSGALVLDADGLVHGLLFAGSSTGGPGGLGLTAINPIAAVLGQLDARLWIG